MSVSNSRFYEGEEWEQYIQKLLKRHYEAGEYQEVPAKHKGDFGIEGYSMNGCVYQCYATEAYTTNTIYEAQRKKITVDIKKFIDNKSDLHKVFGTIKIHRWILMVPVSESALLVQHASRKAQEVLDAMLPYVAANFQVVVATDGLFQKEINELSYAGVVGVKIQPTEVNDNDRKKWEDSNSTLALNLERKASKINKLVADEKIERFKAAMIKKYLIGQNTLHALSQRYPDIYENLEICKRSYENHLEAMNLLNDSSAQQYLKDSFKEYSTRLSIAAPTLPGGLLEDASWEAISDWLMRCPLDFD
jgi:hypothetical protein